MAAFNGGSICTFDIGSEKQKSNTFQTAVFEGEIFLKQEREKSDSQRATIILCAVLLLLVMLLWAMQVYILFISAVNGGVTYVDVSATTEPLNIHL